MKFIVSSNFESKLYWIATENLIKIGLHFLKFYSEKKFLFPVLKWSSAIFLF